ncbi:hypothetical protein [Streptomyces bluensis]|nr:hypothetical protein [Streptomyces bluensis]
MTHADRQLIECSAQLSWRIPHDNQSVTRLGPVTPAIARPPAH